MTDLNNILSISLDEIKAEKCRRSFYYFLKEFWSFFEPKKFVDNWHIEFLCDQLQIAGLRLSLNQPKDKDFIINLPPGSSKSSIVSIAYPAWLWIHNPSLKMIVGTHSNKLSWQFAGKSRDIIESDKYRKWFPEVVMKEGRESITHYGTTRGGERLSTSPKSSVVGFHADLIIIDDPTDPNEQYSEAEIDKVNEWVGSTLDGRKTDNDSTLTILVQQRISVTDSSAFLLSLGEPYEHICIPGEYHKCLKPASLKTFYEVNDGLYNPTRLSREVLKSKLKKNGSKTYNAHILQSPEDGSNAALNRDWFKVIDKPAFLELTRGKTFPVEFYVDSAETTNRKNDPTCILACMKIGQNLYILNTSLVWLEFTARLAHIKKWVLENGYSNRSRIVIEPKSSGLAIFQSIRNATGLNVIKGVSPNQASGTKEDRFAAISPKVEGEQIWLLKGDWNKSFIDECCSASPIHDDQRDCLVMAVNDKLDRSATYGKYTIH